VNWINDLLEELSGSGFLMPSLKHETGVVVDNLVWITKPSGLRHINKIYHPDYYDLEYTYQEIENKIKLTNVQVQVATPDDTADAFQNYAVGSMDINITDAEEDDYEDCLLVIDGGTEEGTTIKLSGNDAADSGYTKVYFYHDLATALDGTKITSCYLLDTTNYVMIEHSSTFDEVSGESSEIPIQDKYERRITYAYLRWKVEEAVISISKETKEFEKNYYRVKSALKTELRSNMVTSVQPRKMPGLSQYSEGANEFQKQFEADL